MITAHDVHADGNCFYRALYQICRHDPSLLKTFLINPEDENGHEDSSIPSFRLKVADAFFVGPNKSEFNVSRTMINNIIELLYSMTSAEDALSLQSMYPLLSCIRKIIAGQNLLDIPTEIERRAHVREKCMKRCARNIYQKPIFASSIEIEIVKHILYRYHDVNLVVLTVDRSCRTRDEQNEKWIFDMRKIMSSTEFIRPGYVAILINHDNLHYMYAKFDRTDHLPTLCGTEFLHACIQPTCRENEK